MTCQFLIRPQGAADAPQIFALHEDTFGPGRFARTAFRIREASIYPPLIALTAWQDDALAGAIHFTPITIGGQRGALLLGPLAITPAFKNKGCGFRLMGEGLSLARSLGFRLVVLVGDLPYYQRAGFRIIPPGQIVLPGPADPARFLAAELEGDALPSFAGVVAADNAPPHPEAAASPALAEPGQHQKADQ